MDVDEEEGEGDIFDNMSPAELIALLRKHKVSPKGTVGSPPNSKWSGSSRDAEVESSSGSSSGSSSSGSSSAESMMKNTSPPSAGGSTASHKPGHGE